MIGCRAGSGRPILGADTTADRGSVPEIEKIAGLSRLGPKSAPDDMIVKGRPQPGSLRRE